MSQGEGETIADTLADETTAGLEKGVLSPVGFSVFSPSNSVSEFPIHYTGEGRLLRLYGRHGPGISVSSQVFFLETRKLAECTCRR